MKFRSPDFLWLALGLFFILSLAFLLPVPPNDYWWYMRIGQETLTAGRVPSVDMLSAAQAGQPAVYHSWLSAVLFWLMYRAGGLTLTVLVRGVVIALPYVFIWLVMRRVGAGAKFSTLILFAAMLATSNNWDVRPQMFSYSLFALSLWALWRWREGENRSLWLLPIASLLWVNLHGSFVMLFLLAGAALFFGEGDRKVLLVALGVALVLTLVNPRGIGAWAYLADSLSNTSSQQFSREWKPPVNDHWQMQIFFGWLLAFIPLAGLSARKLRLLDWVWLIGFGWLALSGIRYVIWFVFMLAIFTAQLLSDWAQRIIDRPGRRGIPAMDVTLGALFLIATLAFLPGLREKWWAQAPDPLAETPVQAVDWIAAHPEVPGPLWSEISFASYQTFALPSRPVWIHTMFEMYPPEQWERYEAVNDARYDWQSIIDEDGINMMLVSVAGQNPLLDALRQVSGWCESYRDDVAAVFIRQNTAATCEAR